MRMKEVCSKFLPIVDMDLSSWCRPPPLGCLATVILTGRSDQLAVALAPLLDIRPAHYTSFSGRKTASKHKTPVLASGLESK